MLQCRRFCSGLSFGMECFLNQVLLTLTIYWESKPRGKRLQIEKRTTTMCHGTNLWRCLNEKARSIIALWLRQTSGLHHRDHNAAINLRNDAVNKIKSTVGTIGTYDCGGQGSRARFSSDVDCSMKQEVQFVRMDNQIP